MKGKRHALTLYEAKMVEAFDHRAASVFVDDKNWGRQGQKTETQRQNPEFCVMPRWWVDETEVDRSLESRSSKNLWFLTYKDVTSPTNER